MKMLFLALITMGCLDVVANHGEGVRGCLLVVTSLIDNTESTVSSSVYRQ